MRRGLNPREHLPGLLVALGMFTGCSYAFSAEQAAIDAVLKTPRDIQVDEDSIKVVQSQWWQGEVVVLVKFQAMERDGQSQQCLFMYEAHRSRRGEWVVSTGGGSCGPVGGSGRPIDLGGGQDSGTERLALSHVKGFVYDSDIKVIEVIWNDGESQRVEVVNGSYLGLRTGLYSTTRIRALDAAGKVVCTIEGSQPMNCAESN